MEYVKNNLEAVLDWLENLDDYDLLNVHRIYCEEAGYQDDEVYENDEEFFEIYFPGKVMDALRAAEYGEYKMSDKFVKFNGLANLESGDYVSDLIDVDELAQYIFENPKEFNDYVELEETDIEELEEALVDAWNDYVSEVQEEEDEDVTAVDIEDVDLYLEGFRERHLEMIVDYETLKEKQ